MFISDALAQTADAAEYVSANSVSGTLIQLGLIFLIFYFLLIRPQQKKLKQHEDMLIAIKKGDKIITGGGVYATVVKAEGDDLTVKIADGVEIKVSRLTVRETVVEEEAQKPAPEKKNTKKASKNKRN